MPELAKPVAHRPTGGLSYNYGLQAIIDMAMSQRMIAERGGPMVQFTLVPMIRIAADDPAEVDRAYLDICSRREKIRLWDSPRERWRKNYGNFVREMEWALLELRKYFTQEQYEEIVVGTGAALARQGSQKEIDFLNKQAQKAEAERQRNPGKQQKNTRLRELLLKIFDPGRFSAFLVGESEITEMDPDAGTAVMEVPNCAWHTCGDPDSLPNPDALPEQGCLLICKGVFERVFDGSEGIKMEFDPHLPETSCTIRIRS
ncbi:MAG: hypothetical protein M5U31_07455 [Acidimicrobiia bacterium]|nr:hypothetical protein [Acidimicrobiia bacterium]